MGWLWRADADGGTGGEETPRRRELPDDTASDMEQWGGSNAAPPEGIVTGNSEFEANRFDMVRPITQERLGLLFDSEGWMWRIDSDGDLCGFWEGHLFCSNLVRICVISCRHGTASSCGPRPTSLIRTRGTVSSPR